MGITTIIFDLGGVLVDVDTALGARRLAERSGLGESEAGWLLFGAPHKPALEVGELSLPRHYESLPESVRATVSYPEYLHFFTEIFREIPESIELLRTLARRYPVYLLSNTDPYHYSYISARYAFMGVFHAVFLSYELACRKPQPEIYRQTAIYLGERPPQDLLFVDDRPENVAAAEAEGWNALTFSTPQRLREALHRLNITC